MLSLSLEIYSHTFLFIVVIQNLVFDIKNPVPVFRDLQTISESSNDSVSLSFPVFLACEYFTLLCLLYLHFFPVQFIHLSFIYECSSHHKMRIVCWQIIFILIIEIFQLVAQNLRLLSNIWKNIKIKIWETVL